MPPKKKTTSSISNAFKPSSSKAAAAVQQGKLNLARTGSLDKVKQSSQPETRSPSPDKASRTPSSSSVTLTKEEIKEAESLPELDVNARDLNGIWNEVKREKLGRVGAIHAQGQNRVHHILRAFDFDPSYGPCLGLTRLERWNRAKNLGEEPPRRSGKSSTPKRADCRRNTARAASREWEFEGGGLADGGSNGGGR